MPYPEGAIVAMKNIILFIFIGLLFLGFTNVSTPNGTMGIAYAQQDWKEEFSSVCSKTQDAMTLSVVELKDLIDRCAKLEERLGELDGMQGGTGRKVYTKRLKMCSNLFKFTLDYKEK
jgi:hypothetical protein